jgi:hypothetical protein
VICSEGGHNEISDKIPTHLRGNQRCTDSLLIALQLGHPTSLQTQTPQTLHAPYPSCEQPVQALPRVQLASSQLDNFQTISLPCGCAFGADIIRSLKQGKRAGTPSVEVNGESGEGRVVRDGEHPKQREGGEVGKGFSGESAAGDGEFGELGEGCEGVRKGREHGVLGENCIGVHSGSFQPYAQDRRKSRGIDELSELRSFQHPTRSESSETNSLPVATKALRLLSPAN